MVKRETIIRRYFSKVKRLNHLKARLILVPFHAIVLIILTVLLQYINIARDDEPDFLKWMAIWRHNILRMDRKPLKDSVVFIDVSRDIELVADTSAHYDADTPRFTGPQQVITDRKKLAELFRILNKNKHDYRYVFCDVLFQDKSPDDSLLSREITQLPRLITAKDPEVVKKSVFPVPEASVKYLAVNGNTFSKWPLFSKDTIPSIPTWLYQMVTHNKIEKHHGLVFINHQLTFGYVMPEFYIRPVDLVRDDKGDTTANTFYLGQLLLAGDDCFTYLQNKYIVIGDFSLIRDTHNTYLGTYPGSLIIWDTFLTLLTNKVRIDPWWLFTLFVFYAGLSYFLFVHPEKDFDELGNKINVPLMHKWLTHYISYLGILIILDFISYSFFGTFLSIFYIATYLTTLHLIIVKWREWKEVAKKCLVSVKVIKS